jgi:hypothetical protein
MKQEKRAEETEEKRQGKPTRYAPTFVSKRREKKEKEDKNKNKQVRIEQTGWTRIESLWTEMGKNKKDRGEE